ncbi:MAG: hypothetical protein K5673_08775 [Lachnospiraceae bacterium]|nr:hypothetical protein [Lachnospiraceae bacterium]
MQWGYTFRAGALAPVPINLEITTHCHALLTGGSGSGKSYALLFLLGTLLKGNPTTAVYFCDFKNSEDFEFLMGYPYYYAGNDVCDGIAAYYHSFCEARETRKHSRRHILIIDEYPALINYLTMVDKRDKTKKASEVMAYIAEILMMGRGIGFGVWIVTQRADSTLFSNGARDNFMIIIGLGRLSKEQKGMVFAGEDIPNRVYGLGEGVFLADGHPIMDVKYPQLSNEYDWKKHIKLILMEYR